MVSVSGPDVPDSPALARGELAAFAAQASQRFNTANVSFGGISIQVMGDRAHVDAEATLFYAH